MSLINDALRKAQKQRTGEPVPLASLPSVGGESAARIHKRGKPAGFNTLLLRLGLGAGGLAVLVIGGYFALRPKPETGNLKPEGPADNSGLRSQVSEPAISPPPATSFTLPLAATPSSAENPQVSGLGSQPSASAARTSSPVVKPQDEPHRSSLASPKPGEGGTSEGGPAPAPVTASTPQVALPGGRPGQTPGGQLSRHAGGATDPGLVATSNREPATVQAPPPKMEGKAVNFIENLRIAGIRASATDAKVLMNDRVYRINDIVEHELSLKLVGITSSSLTFEDEQGARYTRSF